mmetsp:Transcript_25271/g.43637  ORF Transcript_25271/g.43637 Transcript_25271/m.43637 type:complete len:160 (+) Transcript_25271:42-521(+)
MRKFIVAVDGSPSSTKALDWALTTLIVPEEDIVILVAVSEKAGEFGGFPVCVFPKSPKATVGDVARFQSREQMELMKIRAELSAFLQKYEAMCAAASVSCSCMELAGNPKEELCAIAEREKPHILIVGNRGTGDLKRLLLGSTSDYLVHNCTCPVLVVK